jgi:hypothetical protein
MKERTHFISLQYVSVEVEFHKSKQTQFDKIEIEREDTGR